jgi:hypothetical protein
MWQQYNANLNSVLTPQQQQIWAQQVGQAYPVSPNSFMPQRRRDGNVDVSQTVGQDGNQFELYNQRGATAQGQRNPAVTPAPAATQTPAGNQPSTQGTGTPSTAGGTTQGGTVR